MTFDDISPETTELIEYLKRKREGNEITPEHPITGKQLAAKLSYAERGITERDVQAMIQEARKAGHLIGLGPSLKGYFYAYDESEMAPFLGNVESRIGELAEVRSAIRATLSRSNQFSLL